MPRPAPSASAPRRTVSALTLGVLALALSACETSVVIDAPPLEEALVVYSFPQPDSVWSAEVGHVVPLGSPYGTDIRVDDATVRLYSGSDLLDEFELVPRGQNPFGPPIPSLFVSSLGLTPEPGRTYRLEVTAPGYPAASAEAALPAAPTVEVLSDEWEFYNEQGEGGYYGERRLRLALTDPVGADVYELAIVRRETSGDDTCGPTRVCGEWATAFASPSPSFRDSYELLDIDVAIDAENQYYGTVVMRDNLFEGRRQTFDLVFEAYGSNGPAGFTVEHSVVVARVSGPFARYQVALRQQEANEDNPFAEPSPLFSNVVGGHGVVGGFTTTRVRLPDPPPPSTAR